ncbi:MAG: sodium:proline symporter [Planctomycetes bacterium]|nr:sodium:proline symporter [Planctomycetota bacterium]MDP6424363.1 sodium/proline symporter [Planctomycetota bacterium]
MTVLVTLVVYKIVLLAIGVLASRRTQDGADFFLAGRRMGPIVASISASASSSSAWTLLGVSGLAYKSGLSAIWLFPACVGGFCLNWFVLAPALQRHAHASGALTTTDVLARGRRAIVLVASLIILVSLVTYVASQFQAAGKSFAATFEVSQEASILIGSVIIVAYTLLGGFWAVSITDTLQGLVMAGTAIVLPVVAVAHIGVAGLLDGIARVDVPGYANVFSNMGLPAAAGLVIGLLGIGLGYPGQPHVVNRFMALRDGENEMRMARRVAIGWAVVVYAGMIVVGLCARVLLPVLADGETAFIATANKLLDPVFAGIMIAAVLSAVMSTADSQLLVAASTVTHDLGLGGGGKTFLRRSRWAIVALSAFAVIAALTWNDSIFSMVLFAWSAMGCAFGPVLLVTVLRGPVRPGGTLLAMSLGFSLSVAAYAANKGWGLGSWAGTLERVVPFIIALIVARLSSDRTWPTTRAVTLR